MQLFLCRAHNAVKQEGRENRNKVFPETVDVSVFSKGYVLSVYKMKNDIYCAQTTVYTAKTISQKSVSNKAPV